MIVVVVVIIGISLSLAFTSKPQSTSSVTPQTAITKIGSPVDAFNHLLKDPNLYSHIAEAKRYDETPCTWAPIMSTMSGSKHRIHMQQLLLCRDNIAVSMASVIKNTSGSTSFAKLFAWEKKDKNLLVRVFVSDGDTIPAGAIQCTDLLTGAVWFVDSDGEKSDTPTTALSPVNLSSRVDLTCSDSFIGHFATRHLRVKMVGSRIVKDVPDAEVFGELLEPRDWAQTYQAFAWATTSCTPPIATFDSKREEDERLVPNTAPHFPRLLHQTFRVLRGGVPVRMWLAMSHTAQKNATLTNQIFSDAQCREFIFDHFPKTVLHAFDSIVPTAYQSDLFRACLMLKRGGIYLDTKIYSDSKVPLIDHIPDNDIMTDRTVIVVSDLGAPRNLFNGFMAAPQNHVLHQLHIDIICRLVKRNKQPASSLSFGPIALGDAVRKCFNLPASHKFLPGVYRWPRSNSDVIDTVLVWKLAKRTSKTLHFTSHTGKHVIAHSYDGYREDQASFARLPHYSKLFAQNYLFRTYIPPNVNVFKDRGDPVIAQVFVSDYLLPNMARSIMAWKRSPAHVFLSETELTRQLADSPLLPLSWKHTYSALQHGYARALFGGLLILFQRGGAWVDCSLTPARLAQRTMPVVDTLSISVSEFGPTPKLIMAPAKNTQVRQLIKNIVNRISGRIETGSGLVELPAFRDLLVGVSFNKLSMRKTGISVNNHLVASSYKGFETDLRLSGAEETTEGDIASGSTSGQTHMLVSNRCAGAEFQQWSWSTN